MVVVLGSWVGVLTDPLALRFFVFGLLASALALLAGAAAGFGVVLRGESYLGQGIGQAMIAGVAVGSLLGAGVTPAAFAGAALAAICITLISRSKLLRVDTVIAVVSSTSFSLGVAVISSNRSSSVNITNVLFGNVLGVGGTDVLLLGLVALLAWGFAVFTTRRLTLAACAPSVAVAHRAGSARLGAARVLVLAVVVAASVQVVGVTLVVVALVFPAATASLTTRTLFASHLVAAVVACCAALIGMYVSYWADIASGPAIVRTATVLLLAAALLSMLRPTSTRR